MELVWPLFAGLSFVLSIVHRTFLAWWLDPLLQKKANRALWADVQANLYFLCTKGQPVKEDRTRVLPFDYASVCIIFEKVRFCFTRGRGELNVSLSPNEAPRESYELPLVLAALDSKDISEVAPLTHMSEVGDVLRVRLDEINNAFSERNYPEFEKKLSDVRDRVRMLTRQAEWELNKGLYR